MIDGQIGPAADIYALGVTVAECLTGRLPYTDTATSAIMKQILTQGPTVPPGLSSPWDRILPRMVAAKPEDRPTAREVLDSLRGLPAVEMGWNPWAEQAVPVSGSAAAPTISAHPSPAEAPVAPPSLVPTPEEQFATACDEALADGVISTVEKASLKILAERLGVATSAAERLLLEAAERRAKLPLTPEGQRRLEVGGAQRGEAIRAIAELYEVPERRVRTMLERTRWDVDLAMTKLEEEVEGDRRSFALMSLCDRTRITEDHARTVLDQVLWDLDAAVAFVSADDERKRQVAQRDAEQRAADRREKVGEVAKVAGIALAGAAGVAVAVALGGLGARRVYDGGFSGSMWSS
jgi:hypothetical protein